MLYKVIKDFNNYYLLIDNKFLLASNLSIKKLGDPKKLFNYSLKIYKDSKNTKAACIQLHNKLYFLKSYNKRSLLHTLKSIIRTSRPFKVITIALQLERLNIRTPRVIAAIEKRYFNMVIESYILTEFIDGINLPILLGNESLDKQKVILQYTIKFISELHNKGIFHGDLKVNNILVDSSNISILWLLDLDGVKIKRQLNLKEKVKDLARFIVSIEKFIDEELFQLIINNYMKETKLYSQIEKRKFLLHLKKEIARINKRHKKRYLCK